VIGISCFSQTPQSRAWWRKHPVSEHSIFTQKWWIKSKKLKLTYSLFLKLYRTTNCTNHHCFIRKLCGFAVLAVSAHSHYMCTLKQVREFVVINVEVKESFQCGQKFKTCFTYTVLGLLFKPWSHLICSLLCITENYFATGYFLLSLSHDYPDMLFSSVCLSRYQYLLWFLHFCHLLQHIKNKMFTEVCQTPVTFSLQFVEKIYGEQKHVQKTTFGIHRKQKQ